MGHLSITNTNYAMWGLHTHGGRVHPDRVIVPMPKPHDSAPGVVPYHRYLQTQNQIERIAPMDQHAQRVERSLDSVELSSTAKLLPRLGDLPAPDPRVESTIRVEQVQQQIIPATGRMLDQYI